MKKVLIIANLQHASPRIPALAGYLPEFGWEATIITPLGSADLTNDKRLLEKARLLEVNYKGDIFWLWRKLFKLLGFKTNESITEQIKEGAGIASKRSFIDLLMTCYQTIFAYPDTEKNWRKPALKYADLALKDGHFDALLSSSPYPTNHMIAFELKKRFNLPWVADFRDPWTQNHNYPYADLRKKMEEKLEVKILGPSEALVAASEGYARKQELLHKKKTAVITNGFDPALLDQLEDIPASEKFTITYTGTIYKDKQDPAKFFSAIKSLITEKKIDPQDLEIKFYGRKQLWLETQIKEYGLKNIASQYGSLPRSEIFLKQRHSRLLLLFGWEDPQETGVYPQKIFEYLAARRPILLTGGSKNEDIKRMVADMNAGKSAEDVEGIKDRIYGFYNEYKARGVITYKGNIEGIGAYSYRNMAKRFAGILDQATNKKQ